MRCLPKEREALLQFKAAILDPYGMLSSWSTPNCCQWEGIRCSNLTAHILGLHLPGHYYFEYQELSERYISGEIHESLMELRQLEYLNLSSNSFEGSHIPEFLASLTKLKYLDLSSCYFIGEIPIQFGSLSHLKYLNVAYNIWRLQYLDIRSNSLEGDVPSQLGNISQLQHLDLRYNSLQGNIPSQLGNLSQLQELYLGRCKDFRGCYATLKINEGGQWLSNLISLTHLSLEHITNFNTSPSYFRMIAKLPKLRELSLIECGLSNHFLHSFQPSNFNFSTSLSLDLSGNLLKGSTSNRFGLAMNSLQHLQLSFNMFKGKDLNSFMNICTLRSLYMYDNNMTEDLPSILRNFSNGCVRYSLQELQLSYNQITGSVPDLSIFSSLKSLYLSNNQLSGKIPQDTRWPSQLEHLSIGSNSLEDSVPMSFESTCHLESLDLSYNKLSEDLAVVFNHLSRCCRYSLRELYLRENKFNGALPDFSMFSKLEILDDLYLDRNKLNGTISEDLRFPTQLEELSLMSNSLKGVIKDSHFSNMSKLESLDLSDNSLVLKFSRNWAPSFQLGYIGLRSCKVGPLFPKWIQSQNKVSFLDISNNGISDTLPKWFWDKFELRYSININISYNNLQGMIPNLSLEIYFESFNLGSNQFEGPIPSFLRDSMYLDLSNNKFTDSFLFLCSGGVVGTLYQLDLSNNKLLGEIPNCWTHFKSLAYLNMSQNKFSGKIPTSMGSLLELQVLLLRNNNLAGEFSSSLRNCTKLVMLDMTENRLSGSIPDWIGSKFLELQFLSLGNNYFNGSLPLQICYLKSIHLLDLSLNNLSGQIPKCIKNFSSMTQVTSLRDYQGYLYLANTSHIRGNISYNLNAFLMWKGSEQMFKNNGLSLLKSIDLSSNQLSGEIPKEIENLFGLISLNLSRNHLTEKIPSNIGKLTSLEFLDLSRNQLAGSIPLSLAQIDRLTILDLSHNYLIGKIPTGTQLQSFDTSKYEGNVDLCGPPLKKLCIDKVLRQEPIANFHDKDNLIFNREFYTSMTIGFAMSFSRVFGSILIIRSWRHAYFKILSNLEYILYIMVAMKVFKWWQTR
ncbi:hypothetical protein PHAVU_004G103300 [Phaseolus vulgaris]|uniref:Leucine-rich repeat-containing N-terminal plant-type domain-containing protein n=1 Tax=Phaseolus vulgaris TaxID=3885 RepID=V7C5C8_PHAVU|nr:hypothetical protein PHAVU_004G103300g [Phaseolus vulgaris]ESW24106.1 hypothetical protein PHAVU_004G103300g [Phaseolus vulgaris]